MQLIGPFDTGTGQPTYGTSAFANWTNGNPGTGEEGSIPPVQAWSHPQQEIVNAITGAGLTPDKDTLTQLATAIPLLAGADQVQWRGITAITATDDFDAGALGVAVGDKLLVLLWGAGGGASAAASTFGSAGSAGGFSLKVVDAVGTAVTVTIGAGGAGNNAGSDGGDGGTTSYGAVFSATGGDGGSGNTGSAGDGVGGDINLSGAPGADVVNADSPFAPGGAAPFMGAGVNFNNNGTPIGAGGAALQNGGQSHPSADGGDGLCIIVY